MKDFIEGLQKLLPWLAGLQLAPKIVISVIILLAAAFILLLIWSPTTQTKETRSKQNVNMENGDSDTITTLTVKYIIDDINNSAPFQRDDIAKNYFGIKVKWEGELWDIKKTSSPLNIGESVRVNLRTEPKGSLYSIYFDVPIGKYPQFKIAQRGDLIGISGRIINCSGTGMYVDLDVDEIIFHEKNITN